MSTPRYLSIALMLIAFAAPMAPWSARALGADDDKDKPADKADGDKKDEKKADDKKKEEEKKTKTIAEFTKEMTKIDGVLPIYRNKKTGEAYIELRADKLGKEFILFGYTENGLAKLGHFRGCFRDERIVTFKRDYNKVSLTAEDTGRYFDEKSALSRAKDANVSPAVILVQKVEAEDPDGSCVIATEGMLLTDLLYQLKPVKDPDNKDAKVPSLGKLNAFKSRYVSIRGYPENLDVVVEYVYDDMGAAPPDKPEYDAVDPRFISVKVQYSFIAAPTNDFKPRLDDERIGYFSTRVDDMTSMSATPYRDLIHRWDLRKKDPEAAVSEPVEPITWWIENTTPVEFRDTIRDAALQWNKAFEVAGFKNALVIKVQPDDATWDAGDIRYNVLRWTSSPNPPFGGYGPSFVNPRTGQILGADVMLEWVFVTNRVRYAQLFDTAAAQGSNPGMPLCALGDQLHATTMAGTHMLKALGATDVDRQKLVKDSLYYLVLHELGHTLGLNHNMKSSHWLSPEKLTDFSMTRELGLTGSVMDYPSVNLAGPSRKQGEFYTTCPGPYDRWAIEFGYSPKVDDTGYRKKLLARSTEPGLEFGNDADDMRSPSHGVDPRVMIGDMSSDAITYASERITRVREAMSKATDKYIADGESYQELRNAYMLLTREQGTAAGVVARYVGGIYVERASPGQKDAPQPLTPVPAAEQKRAMEVLRKQVFAPDALDAPAKLLAYARLQRRSFDFFEENEDLRLHQHLLKIQAGALDALLHYSTLTRLSDTRFYGNTYTVSQMLGDLTDAVFADDTPGDVNTVRQGLQADYVTRLVNIGGGGKSGKHDHLTQAAMQHELRRLQAVLTAASKAKQNGETAAHREFLLLKIQRALAVKSE